MALAREILARYAELTTGPRIAFFEALAQRFGPDHDAARCRDRGLAADAVRQDRGRGPCRRRAAPAGAVAPAQSRARRHRARWCACASSCSMRIDPPRRPRGGRRRLRPSVLVVVQPRLPGAAPDRLVDAGDHPGKDHPLRGGAPHPRLGRSAPPHRSAGPALLRLLPSGAGRRAADLRRGRADPRDSRRDRADPVRAARRRWSPTRPTTAVFYSISNCQRGLAGVSFGNFLIKQVVRGDLRARIRGCTTFVTLSPVPDFAALARPRAQDRERRAALEPEDRAALAGARSPRAGGSCRRCASRCEEPLLRAAAWYYPACARPPRPAGRCGGALPSRQRRAARAAQLARRRRPRTASRSPTG